MIRNDPIFPVQLEVSEKIHPPNEKDKISKNKVKNDKSRAAFPKMKGHSGKQKAAKDFHERILERNGGPAVSAFALEKDERKNRDVVAPGNGLAAVRAERSGQNS